MAKKNNNEGKQKNSYLKGMKAELKKVVWPTPKELVNSTIAVIVFVLIIGAIVFVLDLGFDNMNKYGITKLQEKVQTTFKKSDDSESNEEDTSEGETEESTESQEVELENADEGETEKASSEEKQEESNE